MITEGIGARLRRVVQLKLPTLFQWYSKRVSVIKQLFALVLDEQVLNVDKNQGVFESYAPR